MNTPENLLGRSAFAPYILTAREDILDILQSVLNRNSRLRTLLEPANLTATTSLLDINTRSDTLLLGMIHTESGLEPDDFLAATNVLSDTSLEASHVQFASFGAKPHESARHPALRIPIPTQLLNVQRRDSYRIATPVTNPIQCSVNPGSSQKPVSISITDISLGGICLSTEQQELGYIVGKIYPGCSIELPGIGTVDVALQIAHITQQPSALGVTRYRIGCAFVEPSNSAAGMVQRYINQLEREEIAKKRGFI